MTAATSARAGDLLVEDRAPAAAAAPGAGSAVPGRLPDVVVAYAGLYDAPLFGHAAPAAVKIDESALRYYASQKDRPRVDAEIRRLRAIHPAWKVPANLYAVGTGNDEQPLWDLFAAGRGEELHAAIQARESHETGWRPSADLLAKMARQETASAIKTLSEAKSWNQLLTLAAAHPDVLGCGTMDLDWRVAEAFAATGAPARTYEIDAAILSACKNRDERSATVRKALDLLPGEDVERLIAAGRTLADGSGEFDELRLDLARRRIGAAAADPAGGEVPASSLEALGAAALRSGETADAALLGWYHFGRKRPAEADGWFKLGLSGSGGDAKLAEGHALALRDLGRIEEAEQLAHAWRERSAALRGLFVSLMTARLSTSGATPVDPGDMADFTAILLQDRSLAAAGALGWTAYGRQDWDGAALWFGRAVDWAGGEEIPDKLVEGYGLTLKALGHFDEAEDFLYPRQGRGGTVRDLYIAVAVARLSGGVNDAASGAFGPELPAASIPPDRWDRIAEVIRVARSAPGSAALGWRSLRDGRPAEAADWFRESASWSPGGAADLAGIEGFVLSLKASGALREAEDAAYAHVTDSARIREAYRGIMVAELTTPAPAEQLPEASVARFAALVETESAPAGAEALGWYRLTQDAPGADRCGYAVDWYRRAIAWSPDHQGTAKGNEGYAVALQRAGHDLDAADVAFAWTDRAPEMKTLAISVMVKALTRDLFAPAVGEDRIGTLSALVDEEHSVAGAQALAWYRYRDAGMGYGVAWFEDAIRWSPDRMAGAKTVEGYASALRDVGRLAEAEEALFPWVDRVAAMRDLYIDTVVSELTLDDPPEPMPHDRLARFIAVATPLRSAAAAQALGWYRFARHEYPDAVIWFKYAVDWWPALPPDADRYHDVPESYRPLLAHLASKPEDYRRTPRAFTSRVHDTKASGHRYVDTLGGLATTWTGYALALRAVGRIAEAEDVAFAWRDRWPMLGSVFINLAIEALTGSPSIDASVDAATPGAYRDQSAAAGGTPARPDVPTTTPPERLKRYATAIEAAQSAGGAAALGWAAAARHDPAEAAIWFKAATDWRPADAAPDAAVLAAYVDALRGAGRIEEAFVAASTEAVRTPELTAKRLDAALDMLMAAGAAARMAKRGNAADEGTPPFAPERLAEAVALAKADESARSAAALGWFALDAGRPGEALPAFKAAVTRAEAATGDAAEGLTKSVEGLAIALRTLGRGADALILLEAWSAKLPTLGAMAGEVVPEMLAQAGDTPVPAALIDRMTALATRTRSVSAAGAFGWYAYAHRDWVRAAEWFATGAAWSPEGKGPLKLVEGYAASLHNQCRFAEAETAAAARMGEDAGGDLRRVYVDSVSDRISRIGTGAALLPPEAARFATATVAASSANGAQALGWYAYRSRQFTVAAAWFEKAITWRPTKAEVYGLASSYRRAGDAANLARVLALYEGRYPSLVAVRRAAAGGREPPLPDFGDLNRRGCADTGLSIPSDTDASHHSHRAEDTEAPNEALMSASGSARHAEATLLDAAPIAAAFQVTAADPGATKPRMKDAPARSNGEDHVSPRAAFTKRAELRSAAIKPASKTSGEAAAALAAKDYPRCLALLSRRTERDATDHATEGWCLLGLGRSAEAAEAFRAAEKGGAGQAASDGALGETLSHLQGGETAAAVDSATRTVLDPAARRTLGLQILAQQANDAYRNGRWDDTLDLLRRRSAFATDTRDLVMLRGWSHYHSGDYDAARRAFVEADAQLSDADSRGALATVAAATTPKAFR